MSYMFNIISLIPFWCTHGTKKYHLNSFRTQPSKYWGMFDLYTDIIDIIDIIDIGVKGDRKKTFCKINNAFMTNYSYSN